MSGRRNPKLRSEHRAATLAVLALVVLTLGYLIACPAGLFPAAHYKSSYGATHLSFSCPLQVTVLAIIFGLGLLWLLGRAPYPALSSTALGPPYKPPQ